MNGKPHSNISPERFKQPIHYMTEAEISAFQAERNVSPGLAGVLNLLPGLGYLYCRSWKLCLIAMIALPLLELKNPWLLVWGWLGACVDGYYCAHAYNSRILRDERRRHNDW
jgi:hypothetical protein